MYADLPLRIGKISLHLCKPFKETLSPLRVLVPFIREVFFRIYRIGYPPTTVFWLDKTSHIPRNVIESLKHISLICLGHGCQRGDDD